jgi:cyclase
MVSARVIPVLLLRGTGLVKTIRFGEPRYIGDPRNAVKIFNEKMVDELALLDIEATLEGRSPRFDLIEEIVSEAFMPVAYGGGVRTVEDASRMIALGVEKIIVCSQAVEAPTFIEQLASRLGSQSIVVCLDVKREMDGSYELWTHSGRQRTTLDPVVFAREAEVRGAGEIVVNSIDRDGTMAGYDLELTKSITAAVNVPIIACGGAGSLRDVDAVLQQGGASAAAAGSLFVFHGRHRSVLISYPDPQELEEGSHA